MGGRTLQAWQLWWELREFLPNTGADAALSQEGVQFGIVPKGWDRPGVQRKGNVEGKDRACCLISALLSLPLPGPATSLQGASVIQQH